MCGPGAKRLDFHTRPIPGDPLAEGVTPGAQLGFLGIELHTRRRNRVNGHVVASSSHGADVSHRGGRPGFVKIEDERSFLVPDFTGNFFFMTRGNLQLNPRAGVLFIDFDSGDLLTLTGTAEVVWDREDLKAFDGAERAWRFHVDSGWRLREALPLRWAFRDLSPNSVITGTWAEARREVQRLAQTWRPCRVTRIVDESAVIRSLHLMPADRHVVPPFEAGQHLPIRLRTTAGDELRRTYTISQAPSDEGLRLSVKREGAASSHLHDHVREGDVIEALGPRGQFTIDATLRRPAVLIGAGVGVTPMVAFARHLVTEGFRNRRPRPLHLVQVARDQSQRAFGQELSDLVQHAKGAMKLHVVLDKGDGGPEGFHPGPLTIDLLKSLLPFDDHEFFLCGPPGFMQSLYDGLRDLGVRDARIQAEAFGPSSLKRRAGGAARSPSHRGLCDHR